MLGTITEFYCDDRQLIAWTMEIIKGNTLRAMWFYQTDDAIDSKSYVWYASLRLTMVRVFLSKGVRYVDLGPSQTGALMDAKVRFGFQATPDWRAKCEYEGDFEVPVAAATM